MTKITKYAISTAMLVTFLSCLTSGCAEKKAVMMGGSSGGASATTMKKGTPVNGKPEAAVKPPAAEPGVSME